MPCEAGRESVKDFEGEDWEVTWRLNGVGRVMRGGGKEVNSGMQRLRGLLRVGIERDRRRRGRRVECIVNLISREEKIPGDYFERKDGL